MRVCVLGADPLVSFSHMVKNCALRGKSTKFGMIIVLGLLNNISYGPQSGGGENFVLRGWGGCSFQINCCYLKESGEVMPSSPYQ